MCVDSGVRGGTEGKGAACVERGERKRKQCVWREERERRVGRGRKKRGTGGRRMEPGFQDVGTQCT